MTTTQKQVSALRASLKQEDAALANRLPQPQSPPSKRAASAKAAKVADQPADPVIEPAPQPERQSERTTKANPKDVKKASRPETAGTPHLKAPKGKKQAPEKTERVSLTLLESELSQLKTLRAALAQAGRTTRKSDLLRAGVHALVHLDAAALARAVDALPAIAAKKKSSKR